jgi:NAD(P)-dependent dehydrogenase (short-subunit alcohol dehydrogenase family)
MRVAGKIALISGGAHGMGAAMARLMASEGAKVVIGDLLEFEGAELVRAIEAKGGQARFHHLDVRSEDGWRAIVADTVKDFGRLDILVNNAGISGSAVEDLYETQAWEALMSINATGVFLGMKYGIAAMKRAGGGAIVNISSISGVVGQDFIHMGYNASKGAVRLMTKSAAAQHGRDNIRVNSVHPGLMPPMRTSGRTADPQRRAEMLSRVPLGRSGRAEEVAHAVLFLASDDASYITGAELHVDGGYLAT